MRLAAAAVLAALGIASAPASTARIVSLHSAKQQTFAALLRETEARPDAIDATKANITVAQCRRYRTGWLCHGSLFPVSFSGIDARSTCPVIVTVTLRGVHVRDSQCI